MTGAQVVRRLQALGDPFLAERHRIGHGPPVGERARDGGREGVAAAVACAGVDARARLSSRNLSPSNSRSMLDSDRPQVPALDERPLRPERVQRLGGLARAVASSTTSMPVSSRTSSRFGVTSVAMREQHVPHRVQRVVVQQRVAVHRRGHRVHDERDRARSRPMPTSVHTAATASMIAGDASMPVFAAPTPMSSATASICAATVSGGISWKPLTPSEFCTVTAVTASMPCTPHSEHRPEVGLEPAPPPESVPGDGEDRTGSGRRGSGAAASRRGPYRFSERDGPTGRYTVITVRRRTRSDFSAMPASIASTSDQSVLLGVLAHVGGDPHRAELRPAHRAEVRGLRGLGGQRLVVVLPRGVRVERQGELVVPAELEAGLGQRVVPVLRAAGGPWRGRRRARRSCT